MFGLNVWNACAIMENDKPQQVRKHSWGTVTGLGSHGAIVHNASMTCHKLIEVNVTILFSTNVRTTEYRKHWATLVGMYGQNCYYCGEFATCIDHIVPVSWYRDNDITNLVLSCSLCNIIAGDKVFDNVEDKQEYILRRRYQKGRVTRAICVDCLLPFDYLVLSPSLFLCAECYDLCEGDTQYSKRKSWYRWIRLLEETGVPVEAHRAIRKYSFKSREQKLTTIVQFAYYGETQ